MARMHRDRLARIHAQLDAQNLDGLVLLGTSAVAYAAGVSAPARDSSRSALIRTVAVVVRGAEDPHVFTAYPDVDDGAAIMADRLGELFEAGSRIGIDELTHPLDRALAGFGFEFVPAANVLGPCKLLKTPDELACIRAAQHINELAMADVQPLLRAGVRQTDLSARFLRRIFELGADANAIDPIWQVMPASTDGEIAFPMPTTTRALEDGDVIWVDTGILVEGYASDFGRTWIVGTPTRRQRDQFRRWREVIDAVLAMCKPGVSALDLCRAAIDANGGKRPWIEYFYLAHGVGTDSAEPPLIGTDLGAAHDEQLVLAPGMVLVLEPVIWDEGAAGYRSEDIYAITDDGWVQLSDYPYDPFSGS